MSSSKSLLSDYNDVLSSLKISNCDYKSDYCNTLRSYNKNSSSNFKNCNNNLIDSSKRVKLMNLNLIGIVEI